MPRTNSLPAPERYRPYRPALGVPITEETTKKLKDTLLHIGLDPIVSAAVAQIPRVKTDLRPTSFSRLLQELPRTDASWDYPPAYVHNLSGNDEPSIVQPQAMPAENNKQVLAP